MNSSCEIECLIFLFVFFFIFNCRLLVLLVGRIYYWIVNRLDFLSEHMEGIDA